MSRPAGILTKLLMSPFLITTGIFFLILYYMSTMISWELSIASFIVFVFFAILYLTLAWVLKLIFKHIFSSVSLRLTAFFMTTAILPLMMVLLLTCGYLLFLVGVTESYVFTRVIRYSFHQRTGQQDQALRFRTHGGQVFFEPEHGQSSPLDKSFYDNVHELTDTDYSAAIVRMSHVVNLEGEPVKKQTDREAAAGPEMGAASEITVPLYSSYQTNDIGVNLNFHLTWPYLTYPIVFPLGQGMKGDILVFLIRIDLKRFSSDLFSGKNSFSQVNRKILMLLLSLSLAFAIFQVYLLLKGLFFAGSISVSTGHLVKGAGQIEKGNFDHRVPALSDPYLSRVGMAINSMAGNIQELFHEKMAREQMAQELEIARHIQSSVLLQGIFGEEMYRIAVHSRASRVVGGDYCNFYKKEKGLEILAGDVSGKGLGAAMYVSEVDGLFYGLAARKEPPEVIVEALHQFFLDRGGGTNFFSATLLDVDPLEGQIQYYRLGDPPLLVKRTDGHWYVSRPQGMVAGMRSVDRILPHLEKMIFPMDEIEGVFLYSDGFLELFRNGESEIIRRLSGLDLTNVEMCHEMLMEEVTTRTTGRELMDDVTFALISFKMV